MCACNSHSLENRRLLWPTLDLKSSTVIVLLSHFHFHREQPLNSLKTASHARVHCTGGEPQQTNATTAEAMHSCAGCGPACGRQIWRFRPIGQCCFSRPSEVVGLYHCTALGLLVYWLTACLFRCRKAKKKWEHFHEKTTKNLWKITGYSFWDQ